MGYEEALKSSWAKLGPVKKKNIYTVRFLADEYSVDIPKQQVLSLSCNIAAPSHEAILILHYLNSFLQGLPTLTEKWISFPELDGGKGYQPSFNKRALDPISRKYGKNPDGLLDLVERFSAKRVQMGDIGLILEAFPGIPILITFWKADEEFGPQVNMLFDANIKEIFPTEDVVVMAGFLARQI